MNGEKGFDKIPSIPGLNKNNSQQTKNTGDLPQSNKRQLQKKLKLIPPIITKTESPQDSEQDNDTCFLQKQYRLSNGIHTRKATGTNILILQH